jgi:hypothetical protein
MTYVYFALLSKHNDGVAIRFHDFPDLVCRGKNQEAATMTAMEVLENHLLEIESVPFGTPLHQVTAQHGEKVIAIGVEC